MTSTDEAAKAVDAFDVQGARDAADDMARAFELAGDRIANALQGAAQRGEFSFSQMAESIARDLARLAVQNIITEPLEGVFNSLSSSLIGAPQSAKISPVNVTMNVSGVSSAADFKKSETQLAAGLARAISQGQKLT